MVQVTFVIIKTSFNKEKGEVLSLEHHMTSSHNTRLINVKDPL